MKVVTPDDKIPSDFKFRQTVFLAGGITGCKNWQNETIELLKQYERLYSLGDLLVFNPRKENFDISDNDAELEQIKWEHNWLRKCQMITYFFDNSKSLQPITLYELGKWAHRKPSVITVTEGYKRQNDVLIQTALDGLRCRIVDEKYAVFQHATAIAQEVNLMEGVKE